MAVQNRLNLDFTLMYNDERALFVEDYLAQPQFQKYPPTKEECETIANYILWGRKRSTDKNSVQDKEIQITTKAGIWDKNAQIESLDGLLEQPTFNESSIITPNSPKWRYPKEIFSRENVRAELRGQPLLQDFEELWHRIDTLDLELNYYDLAHRKRTKPPRETLLARFTPEEAERIKERALKLSQFTYLKKRHLLVELRREQYTLRDTYAPTLQPHSTSPQNSILKSFYIDEDILCAPLGLKYKTGDGLWEKLFPEDHFPSPSDFTQEEIERILKFYWARAEQVKTKPSFDFRNQAHVQTALEMEEQFKGQEDILSNSEEFYNTLNFYISRANLTEVQYDIIQLKKEKQLNNKISQYINKKYGKTYTDNYISTIFHQQIIPAICAAAKIHAEIVENLTFPENFKKCKTCGKIFLCNTDNFVRKARSTDGFSSQCKRCDKQARQIAKEKIKTI